MPKFNGTVAKPLLILGRVLVIMLLYVDLIND